MADSLVISSPLQATLVRRADVLGSLERDSADTGTGIRKRASSSRDGEKKTPPRCSCSGDEPRCARIVSFDEAPAYMQDNKYILSGYRVDYSAWECVKSVFSLHNETGNIWTHLLGFFVLFGVGIYTIMILSSIANEGHFSSISKAKETGEMILSEGRTMMNKIAEGAVEVQVPPVDAVLDFVAVISPMDVAMFAIYHLAAMFCMGASTVYHCSIGHSRRAMECCLQFDLSGIGVLVTASCYPVVYYGLSCTWMRWVYLVVQTIFCAAGIIGPQYPLFNSTKFRHIRALLYGGMAVWGVVPLTHMLFMMEWASFVDIITGILQMYAAYAVGLVFYMTRYPEKLFPGLCDTWFHSHQFWHVFVFLGALIHSNTCWEAFKISKQTVCMG